MAQDVNVSKAWDFYIKNPAIIYLFTVSKNIKAENLLDVLQKEPVNLSKENAQKQVALIKNNPLFVNTPNGIEIDKALAKRLVVAIGNSFGLKKDTSKDEEIERLKKELKATKEQLEEAKNQAKNKEVFISDIRPLDKNGEEIKNDYITSPLECTSDKPYITGFKVPSIYDTSSKTEDIADVRKAYLNNLRIIDDGLKMIKDLIGKTKQEKKIDRKQLLKELTDEKSKRFSDKTSTQKLIYYLSFYPDISTQQKKNILDACKSGLDAQVILDLMETDEELFSIEYFTYMIELAKQNAETRMMIDLSKRLMLGDWFVSAKVDGVYQKFMLRPVFAKEA